MPRFADEMPHIHRLAANPLLTAEEEIALANRRDADPGDRSAVNEFVERNQRLLILIADRFRGRGLDFADLVSAGQLGLIHAATIYDPSRGTRFSTVATNWIEHKIRREIQNTSRAIRIPAYLQDVIASAAMHGITIEEAAARKARVPTTKYAGDALRAMAAQVGSIDDEHPTVSGPCDMEADESAAALSASLHAAIGSLSERHASVVRMYYGLDDGSAPMTNREISAERGVTKQAIQQQRTVAIKELRRAMQLAV